MCVCESVCVLSLNAVLEFVMRVEIILKASILFVEKQDVPSKSKYGYMLILLQTKCQIQHIFGL